MDLPHFTTHEIQNTADGLHTMPCALRSKVQVGRIELPSRGPKPRGLPFSYTRVRMLGLEPRSRAPKARRLATDLHPDDSLEGSVSTKQVLVEFNKSHSVFA